MVLFNEVLGVGYEEESGYDDELTVKALAGDKSESSVSGASPITVISTEENTQETEKETSFLKELDLAYRKEAQVFNSINLKEQMIMAAGRELRTDNDKDDKVLIFFKDFMANLGEVGEESTEEEILGSIFKNQMKYGRYHIETVYNKPNKKGIVTKIVDLALTDPTTMDFARTQRGSIVFDDKGSPVGFTQNLGPQVDTTGRGEEPPENVYLGAGKIFVSPKRIAYFWLYGDKLNPLGLIEPGYKSIIRKQNIEEAQTNSIYARGTFPIIDYVGSPERFPTPKMIKNATEKLAQMQHNRYFAFPYWHRIEPLEVKQSDIVENTIKGLKEEITASVGMPLAFSMGTGEATNRATLNNQQKLLEFSLNDVVKKTLAAFRKQIFKRISEMEGFKDEKGKLIVPYYVWGDVGAEDKDAKAERLTKYLKVGAITPEFVMPFVIKSEDLILDKDLVIPKKNVKKEKPIKENDERNLSSKETHYSFEDLERAVRGT